MQKTLIERVKQEELSRWKENGLIPYADVIKSKRGFDYEKLKEFIEKCVGYMDKYQEFTYDWNERWLDFDPKSKMAKLECFDPSYTVYPHRQLLKFDFSLKYERGIKRVTRSFKEVKKLFNPKELGKLLLNLTMYTESLEDAFLLNFIIEQKGILSFWGSSRLLDFICRSSEQLIAVGRGKTEKEAKKNYAELKQYFS